MKKTKTQTLVSTLAVILSVTSVMGCKKKERSDEGAASTAAAPKSPPAPVAPMPVTPQSQVNVPFNGKYAKFAEATWKNGRPYRVESNNGQATLVIEGGKVTYAQSYTAHGKINRVTQVYSFAQANVKSVKAGGYDVALTFQSITGDTSGYSPDKNSPKLEVRKAPTGWEIGLLTTDNNGVMSGTEFK